MIFFSKIIISIIFSQHFDIKSHQFVIEIISKFKIIEELPHLKHENPAVKPTSSVGFSFVHLPTTQPQIGTYLRNRQKPLSVNLIFKEFGKTAMLQVNMTTRAKLLQFSQWPKQPYLLKTRKST